MSKGIAFCHGHAYDTGYNGVISRIPSYLAKDIQWTYIDIDPDCKPDYVLDITDHKKVISMLGSESYDITIGMGCPFCSYTDLILYLKLSHKLLKPGGIALIPNGIGYLSFHLFLADITKEHDAVEKGYQNNDPNIRKLIQDTIKDITNRTAYKNVRSFKSKSNGEQNILQFEK